MILHPGRVKGGLIVALARPTAIGWYGSRVRTSAGFAEGFSARKEQWPYALMVLPPAFGTFHGFLKPVGKALSAVCQCAGFAMLMPFGCDPAPWLSQTWRPSPPPILGMKFGCANLHG
ncbi:MAG: hypothetical protein ACJ8AI_27690, partial [Rhodopila sp.]